MIQTPLKETFQQKPPRQGIATNKVSLILRAWKALCCQQVDAQTSLSHGWREAQEKGAQAVSYDTFYAMPKGRLHCFYDGSVTVTINWDGMHVPCESIANIAYTVARPLGRSEKSIIDVLVVKSGVVRVNPPIGRPSQACCLLLPPSILN